MRWSAPSQWLVVLRPLGHVDDGAVPGLTNVLVDEFAGMPSVKVALESSRRGEWLQAPVRGLETIVEDVFVATEHLVPVTHPHKKWAAHLVLARGRSRTYEPQPLHVAWTKMRGCLRFTRPCSDATMNRSAKLAPSMSTESMLVAGAGAAGKSRSGTAGGTLVPTASAGLCISPVTAVATSTTATNILPTTCLTSTIPPVLSWSMVYQPAASAYWLPTDPRTERRYDGAVGEQARRANGALERAVLESLWRADGPRTASEVRADMGDELAYTTVMTVLSRLFEKGLAERAAVGRSYAYRPVVAAGDLAAARMKDILEASGDRSGALAGFVSRLTARERASLRSALESAKH